MYLKELDEWQTLIYKIPSSLYIKHGTKFVLICHQIVNNLLSTILLSQSHINQFLTTTVSQYQLGQLW